VDARPEHLRASVARRLWPLVEDFCRSHEVAGLAVGVVRDGEVASRGFGVRDVRTGEPVTPETTFHLASVSKPFVATAIVSLAVGGGEYGGQVLDLDAPVTRWIPELRLADGREGEVTVRGLLSHTSGLPDVSDYGWHDPQLGDGALSEFARSLSRWRLQSDPGTAFSYSNAGFELIGLVLARVTGTTFEEAIRQQVLVPLGMRRSTFLRAEVPAELAASPHVGMPLQVPGDAYPYSRRHAPSSTLHSNLVETCRFMQALLAPGAVSAMDSEPAWLHPELLELMWRPVASVGRPPWEEAAALGWSVGSYRGQRTLSHSGADPGFGSKLVLVPEQRTGVVFLANSNTVPTGPLAMAALDIALAGSASTAGLDEDVAAMAALLPPVVGQVATTLAGSGRDAAAASYRRLAEASPLEHELDDEGFTDVVWGAIELHRTDIVWPLLQLWTALRPDSSEAWTMTGWAHEVDGEPDQARDALRRALALDPENDEAGAILDRLPVE
jgi:CubicO group peptidase (beta-lactamase class C family)